MTVSNWVFFSPPSLDLLPLSAFKHFLPRKRSITVLGESQGFDEAALTKPILLTSTFFAMARSPPPSPDMLPTLFLLSAGPLSTFWEIWNLGLGSSVDPQISCKNESRNQTIFFFQIGILLWPSSKRGPPYVLVVVFLPVPCQLVMYSNPSSGNVCKFLHLPLNGRNHSPSVCSSVRPEAPSGVRVA